MSAELDALDRQAAEALGLPVRSTVSGELLYQHGDDELAPGSTWDGWSPTRNQAQAMALLERMNQHGHVAVWWDGMKWNCSAATGRIEKAGNMELEEYCGGDGDTPCIAITRASVAYAVAIARESPVG